MSNSDTKKRRIIRITVSILLMFVLLFLSVTVFCAVKGYMMFRAAADKVDISQLYSVIASKDNFVTYDELPQFYIDALISTEDKRFFRHPGIDPIAICRAIYMDLRTLSLDQGGSTITQQLAKLLLFSDEKSFIRKFAEVFAAFKLEAEYTKEQLLELYVNSIYFGNNFYGIGNAAYGYYGTEAKKLEDYQCAVLAGIPNAPGAYDPINDPLLVRKRTSVVLNRMIRCDKLTETQAEIILSEYDKAG